MITHEMEHEKNYEVLLKKIREEGARKWGRYC